MRVLTRSRTMLPSPEMTSWRSTKRCWWAFAAVLVFLPARSAAATLVGCAAGGQQRQRPGLWEHPVQAGDTFTIDYRHSSDHTPVHDLFRSPRVEKSY